MRKLAKRLNRNQRIRRDIRFVNRAINASDRDTASWAEERKIPQRFAEAKAAGARKVEKKSDADRLAEICMLAPGVL